MNWLRDSGRKAAFPKAIRSILATSGGELMMDKPRGIYDSPSSSPSPPASGGDIWDGSILLSHRTELLTMVSPPWRQSVTSRFTSYQGVIQSFSKRHIISTPFHESSHLLIIDLWHHFSQYTPLVFLH